MAEERNPAGGFGKGLKKIIGGLRKGKVKPVEEVVPPRPEPIRQEGPSLPKDNIPKDVAPPAPRRTPEIESQHTPIDTETPDPFLGEMNRIKNYGVNEDDILIRSADNISDADYKRYIEVTRKLPEESQMKALEELNPKVAAAVRNAEARPGAEVMGVSERLLKSSASIKTVRDMVNVKGKELFRKIKNVDVSNAEELAAIRARTKTLSDYSGLADAGGSSTGRALEFLRSQKRPTRGFLKLSELNRQYDSGVISDSVYRERFLKLQNDSTFKNLLDDVETTKERNVKNLEGIHEDENLISWFKKALRKLEEGPQTKETKKSSRILKDKIRFVESRIKKAKKRLESEKALEKARPPEELAWEFKKWQMRRALMKLGNATEDLVNSLPSWYNQSLVSNFSTPILAFLEGFVKMIEHSFMLPKAFVNTYRGNVSGTNLEDIFTFQRVYWSSWGDAAKFAWANWGKMEIEKGFKGLREQDFKALVKSDKELSKVSDFVSLDKALDDVMVKYALKSESSGIREALGGLAWGRSVAGKEYLKYSPLAIGKHGLIAADRFTRVLWHRSGVAEHAKRTIRIKNANPETAFSSRAQRELEYLKMLENPSEDAISYANLLYGEATLTQPLQGAFKSVEENIRKSISLRLLFPFARTTLNLIRRGFEVAPTGYIYRRVRGKKVDDVRLSFKELPPAEQDRILASSLYGTSIMSLGAAGYANGMISGSESPRYLPTATWQPNSIQIGESNISFERWGAVGTMLKLGATIAETVEKATYFGQTDADGEASEVISKGIAELGLELVTPKTMVDTMGAIVNLFEGKGGWGSKATKFASQKAGGFIPASSLLRGIRRAEDPYLRNKELLERSANPKDANRYFNAFFRQVSDGIPFLSKYANVRRYDHMGFPLGAGTPNLVLGLLPARVQFLSKDQRLISEWFTEAGFYKNMDLATESDDLLKNTLNMPAKRLQVSPDDLGIEAAVSVGLTPEEYEYFVLASSGRKDVPKGGVEYVPTILGLKTGRGGLVPLDEQLLYQIRNNWPAIGENSSWLSFSQPFGEGDLRKNVEVQKYVYRMIYSEYKRMGREYTKKYFEDELRERASSQREKMEGLYESAPQSRVFDPGEEEEENEDLYNTDDDILALEEDTDNWIARQRLLQEGIPESPVAWLQGGANKNAVVEDSMGDIWTEEEKEEFRRLLEEELV